MPTTNRYEHEFRHEVGDAMVCGHCGCFVRGATERCFARMRRHDAFVAAALQALVLATTIGTANFGDAEDLIKTPADKRSALAIIAVMQADAVMAVLRAAAEVKT